MSDIDLSKKTTRSVAGKTVNRIRIGAISAATVGVLPAFLARIVRTLPDIQLRVSGGGDNIICSLESGRLN